MQVLNTLHFNVMLQAFVSTYNSQVIHTQILKLYIEDDDVIINGTVLVQKI